MESMAEKIRLTQVGAEFGQSAGFAFEKAKEIGLKVKTASSSITIEEAGWLAEYITTGINPRAAQEPKDETKKPKKSSTKTDSKTSKKTDEKTESKTSKEKAPKKESPKKEKQTQKASEKKSTKQIQEITESPTSKESQAPLATPSPEAKKGLRIVRKNRVQ